MNKIMTEQNEWEIEHRTLQSVAAMRPVAYSLLNWRRCTGGKPVSRSRIKKAISEGSLRKQGDCERLLILDKAIRERLKRLPVDQQIRTVYEREWLDRLGPTLRRYILPACWLGPFCVDLFIPNVRGDLASEFSDRTSWGLVAEIDGWIHDRAFKQRKDVLREEYFRGLGIPVVRFENREVCEARLRDVLKKLHKMGTLGKQRRERLIRRVQLETVLAWATQDELNDFFGPLFQIGALTGLFIKRNRFKKPAPELVLL